MNGFRTSRALILDDTPQQAMAIVQALGALGIGSLYHDASPEADYTLKHPGLRLLLLDMVLENRGAQEGDPESIISTLIGALEQILDPTPGFVVLVCWTRHPELKNLITEAFKKTFQNIFLADTILVKKEDYINLNTGAILDQEKFKELISTVEQIIVQNEPVALLSSWEQLVHSATSQTTGTIYKAAGSPPLENEPTTWTERAYAICSALALAERGSRLADEDSDSAVKGFTSALGPLLLDRIEHYEEGDLKVPDPVADKMLETVKQETELNKNSNSLLSANSRASLNTSFNLSLKTKSSDQSPGCVYLMMRNGTNRRETVNILLDNTWRELTDDTFVGLNGNLPQGHYPVLIETSPICDFAQAKGKIPRFVAGFLIPLTSNAPLRDTAAYIRTVSFFRLEGIDDVTAGNYRLSLNSHYLMTLPRTIAVKMMPFMRLRSGIMHDLISWLSSHMSRPGFIQVTPVPPLPPRQEPPNLVAMADADAVAEADAGAQFSH